MDDLDTIGQIRNGNADAYALLVEKYHRPLLTFIFRIVDDEGLVEDIGQEIFLSVYKSLPPGLLVIRRGRGALGQDRNDPVGVGWMSTAHLKALREGRFYCNRPFLRAKFDLIVAISGV